MNPNEKGWLRKYLLFRKRQLMSGGPPFSVDLELGSGTFLYQRLQPTGLIYGHPIQLLELNHPRENEWDENARVKVLMTESFIASGLYLYPPPNNSEEEIDRLFNKVIWDVKTFYSQTFQEYSMAGSSVFNRKRTDIGRIEYLLDQRIGIRRRLGNFWTGFFHNSLIFLDLIYFLRWAETESPVSLLTLQREREAVRDALLRLIAAAANSDKKVSPEEHKLYTFFLQSAALPSHKKKQAMNYLTQGILLSDIDFSLIRGWVLKKYFLDITVLAIRADRVIEEAEILFLERVMKKLRFDRPELDHSLMAIDHFIKDHKPRVHYLQKKQIYRLASERYVNSMRLVVRKNQRRIAQEISESKELVQLLSKSTKQKLTPEEKEKVRRQLIDILKTIPAFTIFMLPGGSITLPLLLKIIPKKILFPSSFLDD